jgi:sugar transferase (PEP-CTERM/EpsH1 system associated)
MKPRLLVVLSRFPFPLDKGDKLRAYHFIKHLSLTRSIYLFALSDEGPKTEALHELQHYCEEIHVLPLTKPTILFNLLKGLFNSLPFQVNYFSHTKHLETVHLAIQRIKPDGIFIQLPRVAEYVRTIQGIHKTIDYQDCFSKIMESRAQSGSWPLKWIYAWEANRLKRYEASLFSDFQQHIIISPSDLEAMPLSESQKQQVKIAPNGVELSHYSPLDSTKEFDVFFAGNMSYPPNVEASVYLVEAVMPLVWKKHPEVKVALIGTTPHFRVKNLASERVVVTGFVEDVRTWYGKGRMLVAPMLIGAGLQNKLLQAMSMEIPCITTPLANAALGGKEGTQVLIGATAEELAQHIVYLLNNKEKAMKIAQEGRAFVSKTFSWDRAVSAV